MSCLVYTLEPLGYKLEAALNLIGYIFQSIEKNPIPVV
jgi:hypothetical protein